MLYHLQQIFLLLHHSISSSSLEENNYKLWLWEIKKIKWFLITVKKEQVAKIELILSKFFGYWPLKISILLIIKFSIYLGVLV